MRPFELFRRPSLPWLPTYRAALGAAGLVIVTLIVTLAWIIQANVSARHALPVDAEKAGGFQLAQAAVPAPLPAPKAPVATPLPPLVMLAPEVKPAVPATKPVAPLAKPAAPMRLHPAPAARLVHKGQAAAKPHAAPAQLAEPVDSDVALISAIVGFRQRQAAEAADCGKKQPCHGQRP